MDKKKVGVYTLILLIGISLTFAYFTGRNITKGDGALTKGTTATAIKNSTVTSKGNIEIDSPDMLPGHKIVSYLEVTATGDNELIPFNIYWEGTNNLITSLNLKVYKSDKPNTELNISANCNKKQKVVSKGIMAYEECSINNIDQLGTAVGEATIETSADTKKVYIAQDQFINSLPNPGETAYYYIVLEYPNEDKSQNKDSEQTFSGEVKIEASNIEADIEMAVYVQQEDGSYEEQTDETLPKDQILDMERTTCNNETIPNWNYNTNKLSFSNYTKSGTMCELYFKNRTTAKDTFAKFPNLTLSENDCPTIDETTGEATNITDIEGNKALLCKGQDDYGDTYYFRGKGENNWVKFADKFWRIVRINGNGTIRLIYVGTDANGNGLAKSNILYNDNSHYSDNTYVGFKYGTTGATKYADAHTNATKSKILTELDSWYLENLQQYENDIDGATGFCNDRTPYDGSLATSKLDTSGHGYKNITTSYGAYIRAFKTHKPIFKCPQQNDLFTITNDDENGNQALENPVGLITADEVMYAGAYELTSNTGYYLYTNNKYWTISPYSFDVSSSQYAQIFFVYDLGAISYDSVNTTGIGIRPVINLKAETPFKAGGDGTANNPFEVEVN